MTIISVVALAFHVLLNWVLVTKLDHGLAGAAIAGNISWWLVVLGQIVYVVCGYFPEAWTGFSWSALKSLASFVKLSIASAVMLWLVFKFIFCRVLVQDFSFFFLDDDSLEVWYFTTLILMVGRLDNPEIAIDAISIW